MTTSHFVVYSSNMKANQIFKRRVDYGDSKIADMVIWEVPQPVQGRPHAYKYRLAYAVNGVCVMRYDNEAGKGDHKHIGDAEHPYVFNGPLKLIEDFQTDMARWNDEYGYL